MYSSNFVCRFIIYSSNWVKSILSMVILTLKLQTLENVRHFIPQEVWAERMLLKNEQSVGFARGQWYKMYPPPPFVAWSPFLPTMRENSGSTAATRGGHQELPCTDTVTFFIHSLYIIKPICDKVYTITKFIHKKIYMVTRFIQTLFILLPNFLHNKIYTT